MGGFIGWSNEWPHEWGDQLFELTMQGYVEDIYIKKIMITPHYKLTSVALDWLKELQNDLQN